MADKNYYPQAQGDSSKAEAEKHVTIIGVELDNTEKAGPYYPGNARSVTIVADGTGNIKVRGAGGAGAAATTFRNFKVQYADVQPPTATLAGVITGAAMPHEFYIESTADNNKITIYINY